LGQAERALDDFSRALAFDPQLAVASVHRGMLLAEIGRYAEASADLQTALDRGADPAEAYYQLALVQLAQEDRSGALKCVQRALENDASYAPALSLKNRLDRP
jgi:tetratricopeptide (TPR) repeat protein